MITPATFILVIVTSSAVLTTAKPSPNPSPNPVPEPKPHHPLAGGPQDAPQETLKVSETGYGNRVAYNPPPPPPPPPSQQTQQVHVQQEEDYPLQQNSYGPQSPAYSTKGGNSQPSAYSQQPQQQQQVQQQHQQQQQLTDAYDSPVSQQQQQQQEYSSGQDHYNSPAAGGAAAYAPASQDVQSNSYSSAGASYGATKGGSSSYSNPLQPYPSPAQAAQAPSSYGQTSYGASDASAYSNPSYSSGARGPIQQQQQQHQEYASGPVSQQQQSEYATETGLLDGNSNYGSDDASFGGDSVDDSADSYGSDGSLVEGPVSTGHSGYPGAVSQNAAGASAGYPSSSGQSSYTGNGQQSTGSSGASSSSSAYPHGNSPYQGSKGGAPQYQSPQVPSSPSSYLPAAGPANYGSQQQQQQQQQSSYGNSNSEYDAPAPILPSAPASAAYGATKGASGSIKGSYNPRPPVRPILPSAPQSHHQASPAPLPPPPPPQQQQLVQQQYPQQQQHQQPPPQQHQQQYQQPPPQQQQLYSAPPAPVHATYQQGPPVRHQPVQLQQQKVTYDGVKGGNSGAIHAPSGYAQAAPAGASQLPLSYGGFKPLPQYQTTKAVLTKPIVLEIVQKTPSEIRYPVSGPSVSSYTSGPVSSPAPSYPSVGAIAHPGSYKAGPAHATQHLQQYEEQADLDEYDAGELHAPAGHSNYGHAASNAGPGYPQRPRKPTSENYQNAGYQLDYGRGKPYGGKWLSKPYGKRYNKPKAPLSSGHGLYGIEDDDSFDVNLPLQYGPPPPSSSAESLASYGLTASALSHLALPSISAPSFPSLHLPSFAPLTSYSLRSPFKNAAAAAAASPYSPGYPSGALSAHASSLAAATPLPSGESSYSDDLTEGSYSLDKPKAAASSGLPSAAVAASGSAASVAAAIPAPSPPPSASVPVSNPTNAPIVASYPIEEDTAPAYSYKSAASKLIPNIVKAPFKTIFKAFARNSKLIG